MKKTLLTLTVALATGIATLNAQVTNGLVAKYSFNNGNANDEVGNNHGIVNGATLSSDRFNNPNKSYSFNDSQYIALPDAPQLKSNTMTVSLWVKINGYNSGSFNMNPIFGVINRSVSAWIYPFAISVRSTDGKYWADAQNSSTGQQVNLYSNNANNGNWQHLVLAMDFDSLRFYVDNIHQWSAYKGYNPNFSSDSVCIGSYGHPIYSGYLKGNVDDIRVYNRVLSLSEIDSLFNEPNPLTTGINNNFTTNNTISIYPNPTNNLINFSIQTNAQLTSVTGQIVADRKNVNTLDLSEQPAGIYFLTLTANNGQVVQRSKIVKE